MLHVSSTKSLRMKFSIFFVSLIISFFVAPESEEKDLIGKSPAVIGVSPDSLQKDHLIFLFSPTCPHCKRLTRGVKKEQSKNHNVTGITFAGHEAELQIFKDSLKVNFPILIVEKAPVYKYFKGTPRFIYVHEGIINDVTDSLKVF